MRCMPLTGQTKSDYLYPCSEAWSMSQTKCVLITLPMMINVLPDRSVAQPAVTMDAANPCQFNHWDLVFLHAIFEVFYIHQINLSLAKRCCCLLLLLLLLLLFITAFSRSLAAKVVEILELKYKATRNTG